MTLRDMSDQDLDDLVEAVKTFGDTVASLKKRRNRLVAGLIVSVLLDILLSVGLGVVAIRANDTASTARRAAIVAQAATTSAAQLKASEHTRCLSGNEFRAADRARWENLINLSKKPTTPEAQQRLAQFVHFIDVADKPKVC